MEIEKKNELDRFCCSYSMPSVSRVLLIMQENNINRGYSNNQGYGQNLTFRGGGPVCNLTWRTVFAGLIQGVCGKLTRRQQYHFALCVYVVLPDTPSPMKVMSLRCYWEKSDALETYILRSSICITLVIPTGQRSSFLMQVRHLSAYLSKGLNENLET